MTEERKQRAMEKKTETDIRNAGELGTPADEKRRRLAKAALATPVLGALASKSALGQGRQCSASVLMSGNTSVDIIDGSCGGCSPGFWLNATYKNPTAHACHWPCRFGMDADVGTVLGLSAYTGTDAYSVIRDTMVSWTVDKLNSWKVFKPAVKKAVNDNGGTWTKVENRYAKRLFQFTRAAVTAQLNAETLGATFPILLDSSLPSTTTIATYVEDVFNADDLGTSKKFAKKYEPQLSQSWDGTGEEACRMFGNCAGSMDCGVI